jgi:hypothetical protein
MVWQELVPVCAQPVQVLAAKRFLWLLQLLPLELLLLAEQLVRMELIQLVPLALLQLAE